MKWGGGASWGGPHMAGGPCCQTHTHTQHTGQAAGRHTTGNAIAEAKTQGVGVSVVWLSLLDLMCVRTVCVRVTGAWSPQSSPVPCAVLEHPERRHLRPPPCYTFTTTERTRTQGVRPTQQTSSLSQTPHTAPPQASTVLHATASRLCKLRVGPQSHECPH